MKANINDHLTQHPPPLLPFLCLSEQPHCRLSIEIQLFVPFFWETHSFNMVGKIFNLVSISAVIGIFFLFTTLWNLQSRDPLYRELVVPSNVSTTESANATNTTAEMPEPTATRPSFLEIATKHGTDKVNPHHYNFSMS